MHLRQIILHGQGNRQLAEKMDKKKKKGNCAEMSSAQGYTNQTNKETRETTSITAGTKMPMECIHVDVFVRLLKDLPFPQLPPKHLVG